MVRTCRRRKGETDDRTDDWTAGFRSSFFLNSDGHFDKGDHLKLQLAMASNLVISYFFTFLDSPFFQLPPPQRFRACSRRTAGGGRLRLRQRAPAFAAGLGDEGGWCRFGSFFFFGAGQVSVKHHICQTLRNWCESMEGWGTTTSGNQIHNWYNVNS